MNDTKIITVTLSPSLDRTLVTHYLAIGYENRVEQPSRLDPAGEGLNISRSLHRLGIETRALVLLGDDATARAYRALIAAETLPVSIVQLRGRMRTNTILLDTGLKSETQISEGGAETSQADLDRVAAVLDRITGPGDIVVLAGALPPGAPAATYAWLTRVAHGKHARVAAVACGPVLNDTLPARPDMVTLTHVEAEGYFNYPVRQLDDLVGCARKIKQAGAGQVLIEQRQTGQAVLVTDADTLLVTIPEDQSGTTSGVWDAMVAGFLAGRVMEQPISKSLELGAASASYTASRVGSEFGTLPEVKEKGQQADIEPVSPEPDAEA